MQGAVMGTLAVVVMAVVVAAFSVGVQGHIGFESGGQEWDYVDVRQGAHMFYWLYYVKGGDVPAGRPLVLWLQGGPGASSTSFGNFEEIGPLDLGLKKRDKSWVNHVNLMFVDNPVGTGFSFVDDVKYLARDNQQIAADLVQLYLGFLRKNKQFRGVPLYIFCESYGGKMAAEFAYELHKEKQRTNNADINLRGVALGDGWISGLDSTTTWAPYLQQNGLLSGRAYKNVDTAAQRCRAAVEAEQWERATNAWSATEFAVMFNVPDFSGDNFYNIYGGRLRPDNGRARNATAALSLSSHLPLSLHVYERHALLGSVSSLMNRVRRELGLPGHVRHQAQSSAVFSALSGDFMKPVTDIVERLLSETAVEVSVYNGEWDLIVDIIGTLDWVNRLQWAGAERWKAADQEALLVGREVKGYSQSWGNFTFYKILEAGHMVPSDNPDAAIAMLRQITHLDLDD